VQRDSNRHGPRLDEELKKETQSLVRGAPVESRAEEWREQEGAADGEREPSARTRAGGLDPDELTERSDVSRHLRLSVFPADREALLREAEENNAPSNVLDDLGRLPAGVSFRTVHEVWAALGGTVEKVAGRPLRRGGGDGPTNREQRRHPDRADARADGARKQSPASPDGEPKEAPGRHGEPDARTKSSGHKKKTADKWNQ